MKIPILLLANILLAGAASALAENIVFPADAGVVDMTKPPYELKGDGKTDNTAAFQKAFDELKGKNSTLYFPNGTYLISGSVGIFDGKAHSRDRFINLQGQSEAGAVIRLRDNSAGFDQAAEPKVVVSMYQGVSTGDVMHTYVRNLTVDVGSGNPGAAGLRFLSNNSGAIYNLTVRSSDPKKLGAIGLDLRQGQNGPAFIKNVTVDGFDRGIETGNSFALVFEHIKVSNQRQVGFNNITARTTIRDLKSQNSVPALKNMKHGEVTLVEADLSGGAASETAIQSDNNKVFLRDIKVSGYGATIKPGGGEAVTGKIDEWYSGKAYTLFDVSTPATLRLPIEATPEVPWETDLSKWVPVGAVDEPGGLSLQQAIDKAVAEKKTTVYFPKKSTSGKGTYVLSAPVRVHGSVNRIIGLENMLWIDEGGTIKPGEAVITFDKLDGPVVFERFFNILKHKGWKGLYDRYLFDNQSSHPVVIRNLAHGACLHKKPAPGKKWFIEDVAGARMALFGAGEKVWMRQYNPESPELDMCRVDGGQLWLLGLKTEGRSRHVVASGGAQVEVLGGVSYQSWKNQPLDPPIFTVADSDASFTFGFYHYSQPFTTVVEETRGGVKKTLPRKDIKPSFLPLYRANAKP